MHFSTIINLVTLTGLVSSAPLDANGGYHEESPALAERQGRQDVEEVDRLVLPPAIAKIEVRGISLRPSPSTTKSTTSTTKSTTTTTKATTTTTKSTTTTTPTKTATSTGIWTSVNQANCPTSYPTAQPDFTTIPTSCGQSWLDIVNMWRRAYNKSTFVWSAHLAQVAYGAAFNASGGAKPFKHSDLGYWDSLGEVESPGYVIPPAPLLGVTPFSAAIINWLCEVPSDIQLQVSGYSGIDLCTKIQKNVDYIGETPGETGHHDILLGGYSQIGCAFVFNTNDPTGPFAGIYVCDFH